MNKMRYFFIIVFSFSFLSCEFQKQTNSTGKPLEIILIQAENCSKTAFDIFKKNLIIPQTPLLETEIYGEKKNFFRIISISEKNFNSIFRTHKNIVFVISEEDFNLQQKKDLWSKNQNVYICSIDSNQNNNKQIINLAQEVAKQIKQNDIKKRVNQYNKTTPDNIKIYLHKKHGLSISLPANFFIADSLNETLSLRGDTKKSSQRILINPFTLDPTIENIILEQNRIAKKNISSDIDGSFVRVEERTKLYIDSLKNSNQENINIKGLWKMEKDFMGGGFFTTLITNPKTQNKILVSIYLYAPGENKANYLLDLEAILTSIKYINN